MSQPAVAATPPRLQREATPPRMLLMAATVAGLLAAYPIALLAVSAFLLINLSASTSRPVRLVLAMMLALSLSLMIGTRTLTADGSNDIDGYYLVYGSLAEGDLSALLHFGGGFEVALPLLMLAWAVVLPPLSVNGLMFCLALTGSLLTLVWVEKTFYSGGNRLRPALMGVCLLLLNLYFATQLVRQFLALVMLLYAFTAVGRGRQAFFLAIATTFHLTALPFFALYLLARRGWAGWLFIIVLALLLRVYFWQLLVTLDILPVAAVDKLLYYVDNIEESSASDIGSLRMIFLLAAISIAALIAYRFRPPKAVRPWLAIPWITVIVHYLLLPIPLASLRTTLMIHSVAPGLIAYMMLSGRTGLLFTVTLHVLLIYKVAAFALAEPLRSTVAMVSGFFL